MTPNSAPSSRRDFIRNVSGGLLVGFALTDSALLPQAAAAVPATELDSWLHIGADGVISVFTGKVEIGMGVQTALIQVLAEELDVPFERVNLVMGDTSMTPDQGGVGGSTTIASGTKPLRNAAATARHKLLQMASAQWNVPIEQLRVSNGTVTDGTRNVTYASLVNGHDFNETLTVQGAGSDLTVTGSGKPKDPSTYSIVGKAIPRIDLPPKILGTATYVTDVRVDGMLHGRVIRPAAIGATVVNVDDSACSKIPGFVKTVVQGAFVGVVAENEWAAIRAARNIKVTWSQASVELPDDLYSYMRSAPVKATAKGQPVGDVDAALANSPKKLQAAYQWPFQSHATMGPGCAIADVRKEGVSTVWCGTQKPHPLQRGIAEFLQVPLDRVRVIWVQDAGSYGRAGHEDTAADAVLLSREIGKPVRVQWMRQDMTTWGPKGPATVFDMTAGLGSDGLIHALDFGTRTFSGGELYFQANSAGNLLAGQLTGIPNTNGVDEFVQWGAVTPPYRIPNLRSVSHIIPPFLAAGSPLRTTHLRDPNGPSATFAAESFVDEAAHAAGVDPLEYRLRSLDDARAKAVLTAAGEHAKWERRVGTSPKFASGRGVSLALRNGTYVATVAEVDVDRATGKVRVKRLVCAHDCGLIVNPSALRSTISANLVQATGRALKEEVRFDKTRVTSADWTSYPVVRASDVPAVEIVLINRPDVASSGAGEPSSRGVAAAINNAVFDAIGVRIRTAPLTPERVKAALA